ncbi:MAG: DUF1735 domain-containing protein [Chitinophagales bacterium]
MMKRNYLFAVLLAGLAVVSCKRDYVYGDITPNTERVIVEFIDANNPHSIALDYSTNTVTFDVEDVRFMVRSAVNENVTVSLAASPDIVADYNAENGTNYSAVPFSTFGFEATDLVLSPTARKQTVRLKIKPSDVAVGEWAIGLKIANVSSGEVSQTSSKLLILLSVKNKYDGVYHLKGFYTRTDNPAYHGPFETDVMMITTGPTSVAMYSDELGGYTQPFFNAGDLFGFSNVGPEVIFNASDLVSGINNYVGDPAAGPFMTPFPGANSRYVGATRAIYLKYYYNTNPANRIFADTLIYTGPR